MAAVTASVQFPAPDLELTMVRLVTVGLRMWLVTRELAQLLGAALLAHCARAPS